MRGARQPGEQKEFLIGSICDANSLAEKVEVPPSFSLSVYGFVSCDRPPKKASLSFDLGMEHVSISLRRHSIKRRAIFLSDVVVVVVVGGCSVAQSV